MNYTLSNECIENYNESTRIDFPKYTSQIINLANQNAQGTRPAVVGQMTELFQKFMEADIEKTIDEWEKWYTEQYPESFKKATQKIHQQIQNLVQAINLIDEKMICSWVHNLVINKTFNGLYVQKAILAFLAEQKGITYRLATPEEESRGIDGYLGEIPYSIKPDTYKMMKSLSEIINVRMIYYTKTKTGLKFELED